MKIGGAWCQRTLLWMYLTIPVTSATYKPTFSALRRLKKLPKKQKWSMTARPTAYFLSHIDYRHTRHCEDCLCQRTMQRAFWKHLSRGMHMAEWKMGPPTFQNTPPHLEYPLVFHTSIQQSHNNPKLLFNNKWSEIIHYIFMVTLAHCTNLFLRKKMKETNKEWLIFSAKI